MRHILLSALVFCCMALAACSGGADQSSSQIDTLYNRASDLMAEGYLDSAQACFDTAFATVGVEHSEVYPLLLNEQATLMTWRGERSKAISAKRAVIPYLKSVGNTELDVSVFSDLGLLYHRSGKTDSAIYFHVKADSAARVLGDPGWHASVTQNIGVMYYNLGRMDDADRYLSRAAEYGLEADDAYSIVCAKQLKAIVEVENGQIDSAGINARGAWQTALHADDLALQLRCIPSLYRYFEAKGMTDSVDYYMAIGDTLYNKMPANSIISLGFVLARARMHRNRGEWADALRWYEIQKQAPMQSDMPRLMAEMADCYRGMGKYDHAFASLDSSRILADSIARTDAAAMLEEFNVKYKTMEHMAKNVELSLEVVKRDRVILSAALVLALIIAAAFILYKRSRDARTAMAELDRRRKLELAQNYINGLEDERKRFAKELHDGVANDLLALKMKILSGNGDADAIEHSVNSTRETVRRIAHELMPPEFDNLTIAEVLRDYIAGLNRDSEVEISFVTGPGLPHIPSHIQREIYRITQEYLMNLLRYGNARQITVRLTPSNESGTVELTITDDSTIEFSNGHTSGIGLRTISDRAKSVEATINREKNSAGNNIFHLNI